MICFLYEVVGILNSLQWDLNKNLTIRENIKGIEMIAYHGEINSFDLWKENSISFKKGKHRIEFELCELSMGEMRWECNLCIDNQEIPVENEYDLNINENYQNHVDSTEFLNYEDLMEALQKYEPIIRERMKFLFDETMDEIFENIRLELI